MHNLTGFLLNLQKKNTMYRTKGFRKNIRYITWTNLQLGPGLLCQHNFEVVEGIKHNASIIGRI